MQEQFSGQVKGLDYGLTVKMALVPHLPIVVISLLISLHSFIPHVSKSFSSCFASFKL